LLLPIAGGITGYKKEKEREHGGGEATVTRAGWGARRMGLRKAPRSPKRTKEERTSLSLLGWFRFQFDK
jgi:hypothetical protein